MKYLVLFSWAAVVLLFIGCTQQLGTSSLTCPANYMKIGNECCLDVNSNGICDRDEGANPAAGSGAASGTDASSGGSAGSGTGAAGAGAGNVINGLSFSEWKSPDGSITLQVPQRWNAVETQVDKCTVNWAVQNPAGTSSAFANNQILVFKSDNARQTYASYGLQGAGSAPISGYLGAEQALTQVVAPLAGSSNVKITGRDMQTSSAYSQAVCMAGLAACDAQVLDVTFDHGTLAMRGMYLVQASDLGDGSTWWINVWGYESPAAEWSSTNAVLQKTFSSINYTSDWASKCGTAASAANVIHDVIIERQKAADRIAQARGQ